VDLNNELPRLSLIKNKAIILGFRIVKRKSAPKVILFLGSNIGNMSDEIAT
jgi:hypothetical protein